MSYLSKHDILSAPFRTVDVEAFGGTVMVRELPADAVQRFFEEKVIEVGPDGQSVIFNAERMNYIRLAAAALVDPESRRPMFTQEDARKLGAQSFGDIQRVALAAMDITDWGQGKEPKNG